jgi:ATP-dependent exoDNAse (exonuclease V) alpha subunit
MFVKNDLSFEKNYFNGKMGIIKSQDEITVHFLKKIKPLKSIVMNGKIFVTK